jgi:glycosyltransferase involved in cell wall biosynthesis
VFAGQITGGDYRELLSLPNVYHLGRVPYEKIPILNTNFDVCLLQWKVTDWIRNCNPLKLFEYMASGKPIVSVEINEVVDNYAGLVSVAYSKEEYCRAISDELAQDTAERRKARIEIAAQHGWDAHIEIISGLIEQTMKKRSAQEESGMPKCR